MANLKIYCENCKNVEREVEVHNATSMEYASLHVAEQVGWDAESEPCQLYDADTGKPIDGNDVAADWHDKLIFIRRIVAG